MEDPKVKIYSLLGKIVTELGVQLGVQPLKLLIAYSANRAKITFTALRR